MNGNALIKVLALIALVPATTAMAVQILVRSVVPDSAARRYAAALAIGIAFFVGIACLFSWTELVPKRHWHWLPYLCALAMVLGPVTLASGVYAIERLLVQLFIAGLSAWLLVPSWSNLAPPRWLSIPLLTVYLFLLVVLLDRLPERLPGHLLPALLAMTALWLALAAAANVSETYGLLIAVSAAATIGTWAGMGFRSDSMNVRGLITPLTIILGGAAYVCCVELEPPLFGALLMPAAPLALWFCSWEPLVRLKGWSGGLVQTALVLLPLVTAFIWISFGRT